MYTCKYCEKKFEFKYSLGGHVSTCQKNPKYLDLLKKRSDSIRKNIITINSFCKKCGNIFEQTIKENGNNYIKKYCSRSCANTRKHCDETKQKIKESIDQKNIEINKYRKTLEKKCIICNKEFKTKKKTQKICSVQCKSKHLSNIFKGSEEISKRMRKLALKRYKENDPTIGWQSRKKRKPSYPEQITINILDKININYEFEKPAGKYFIDFAFDEYNLALEIDGKQHEYSERKKSDIKKDKFLKENGWNVVRIKWINDYKHGDRVLKVLQKYNII